MSVPRVLAPLTSSSTLVLRFASHSRISSTWPCQHVLRTFSSSQPVQTSSKRKMQTSTAYQPYPMNNQPPPPRNTGIPDTSIAGGIPQVNDTRPPKDANGFDFGEPKPVEASTLSLPEVEAQKSQPATKPRRYKFKPTKAAMKLTSTAVDQLRAMQDEPDAKIIKVGVKNRGCSGLAYHLEYVEKAGPFDEVVEQDGVKVLIDSKALFSIVGSEMDWVEDKLNQRFTFTNPNIKEQCGCGESFMV
ncbi:HesB-like protein [Glarea lozoyensis ATCC 20868]|uniref:Iron-sulfur assembly protein 1 n=1 Tax=Glarea lozoyensis (strain ATCC 20868 / MF5171) TaxID=1116229 RepID=S3CS70_GLAL2|nr:HesB-like protein [Glarea lozoyensis ATCC 20868]EPE28525.1 HesB-like protein [Glarea lozoyensis ATCC 20868]